MIERALLLRQVCNYYFENILLIIFNLVNL